MLGLLVSSSQKTAPKGHASTHLPQPMHLEGLSITPPPFLKINAFATQTLLQGGSGQALHTTTVKPLSTPPIDFTRIADLARPPSPNLLEHANMHNWQPTHLSISMTESLLAIEIFLKDWLSLISF